MTTPSGNECDPQAPDMGDQIEVFKPMRGNIVAGFIISALLVVGGASALVFPLRAAYMAGWDLPADAKKGLSWLAVGLAVIIGSVLLACGVALAVYCRGLIAHRVAVHANGFQYCSRGVVESVLWAHVGHIRETILYERPPILKGPAKLLIPKVANTNYVVVTSAGKEYGFDGNSIRSIKRFGKVLRGQADRLSLPWETVEKHV